MSMTRGGSVWLAVLVLCGRAAAHTVLVASSVGLDAAIVKANVEVPLSLRFSAGVQTRGSTVELVPERGEPRKLQPVFGPGPGDVALTLPKLPAGRYALRYHVLAVDGHVTDGELPLQVRAPE